MRTFMARGKFSFVVKDDLIDAPRKRREDATATDKPVSNGGAEMIDVIWLHAEKVVRGLR